MQMLISLPASGTPSRELGHILSDYLALDRARMFRRLMVARFGCLALLAAMLETVFHGFSPFARVFTVACASFHPPGHGSSNSRASAACRSASNASMEPLPTELSLGPEAIGLPDKKVVKSS